MESNEHVSLTDEQKRSLQEEKYIAELLRIRGGQEDKKRTLVKTLFETAGGTALITVLLGGILGTILNSCIQINLKDREFQQSREQSKSELAVTQYKDYLEHRQEAIKSAYELVGRCASACYSLALRMSEDNNPRLYPTKQDLLIKENDETYNSFLKVEDEWRSKRDSVALLVSYYYETDGDVMHCWTETRDSVNKYLESTEVEFRTYRLGDYTARNPTKVAEQERAVYETKISEFTQCLKRANKYLWKEYYPDQPLPTSPTVAK
jgi:hypothetical protein